MTPSDKDPKRFLSTLGLTKPVEDTEPIIGDDATADRPGDARLRFNSTQINTRGTSAQGFAGTATGSALDQEREYIELKLRLHRQLVKTIDLSALMELSQDEIFTQISYVLRELLAAEAIPLDGARREQLIRDVVDEFQGLGPIEPLLKDSGIADILVNGPDRVYVERNGKLEPTNVTFQDNDHLTRIIERIVMRVGRRIDESQPMIDARLADGSRVNAVIPPITIDGASLSIRKFSKENIDLDRLTEFGAIRPGIAKFLSAAVRCHKNIIISGGTGAGKTTMLNALSGQISPNERIITIEDAAELQLQQDHVVRMETRPPSVEGRGEVTSRHLLKNALRMRPDRIIIGEVRSGEAFDMLQAMNTGHDGAMTTIHANSPRDAMRRLEQMISMAGLDLSLPTLRMQMAAAIHLVLQVTRLSDGQRKLVSIQEVVGYEGEVLTMQEIFRFRRTGVRRDGSIAGVFESTGITPRILEEIEVQGGQLPPDLFYGGEL